MQHEIQIRDILNIQQRFLRSTQIERDFYDPTSLDGYVVTPHICESLNRINDGLSARSGARSWRITGDYGSGKSSFALLLAQLYSGREFELRPKLQQELLEPIQAIKRSGIRFQPILVSGSREPLATALVRAIGDMLRRSVAYDQHKESNTAKEIDKLLSKSKHVSDDIALSLLAQAQKEIAEAEKNAGVLIILDELGKFLEFAALHPEKQDIFFLQQLAEMAARSAGQSPLFVIGLLHQGFSSYTELLSQSAQREWEKVAGRFQELIFDQSLEQIAYLLAEALSIKIQALPKGVEQHAASAMRDALDLHWYGATAPSAALQNLAIRLYPLHPSLIPPLVRSFKRWGQNERSLFSFLLSSEPGGLQEFCISIAGKQSFYRISDLYEYVAINFGQRLASQSYRSHWNHIDSLVRSFPSKNEIELSVLKTVALLNLLEAPELPPTSDIIAMSVADGNNCTKEQVCETLEYLHRERHILYFRGKLGGYCLWSHMSVNLDAAYDDAGRAIKPKRRVSQWIKESLEGRPLIARRHYIQTGTLRTFDVIYCNVRDVEIEAAKPLVDSDGRILIPLCETQQDVMTVEAIVEKLTIHSPTLIGIPEPLASLEGLVREVEKWKWVERNTSGLKDDKYAAEEVARQLSLAIRTLENRIDYYIGMQSIIRKKELSILWFYEGKKLNLLSGKALTELMSIICDEVYCKAPTIHNELINRKSISAAATLARTKLIEKICTQSTEPFLGLEPSKKPPEMAIYLSLLKAGNIHKEHEAGWQISMPQEEEDVCNLRPALSEIGRILQSSGGVPVPITLIQETLRREPFGIRDGVLPILLSLYLQINWHRTALYEDETYLHNVGSFEFVRMSKEPEHFMLQHCAIEGVRAEVFTCLLRSFDINNSPKSSSDLLELVRPFAIFAANLPDYSRRTKELSAVTINVRSALFDARDPTKLIFVSLPNACGLKPFDIDWTGSEDERSQAVLEFASNLKEAINELRSAYDNLLTRIEAVVISTFGQDGSLDSIRMNLRNRVLPIIQQVTDVLLKPFLFRITDDTLQRKQWLEALASQLVKKPPERWNDQDEIEFVHQLKRYSSRLSRVEAFAHHPSDTAGDAFHLILTRPDGEEIHELWRLGDAASIDPKFEEEVSTLVFQHGKSGLAIVAKTIWNYLNQTAPDKDA